LSNIKTLAGQTFWYGFSNIFGRFLNYLLTPLLTGIYDPSKYGDISLLFAAAAFLNIVFTYGMETAYFRFNNSHPERDVYATGLFSLLLTTVILTAVLMIPVPAIAGFMKMPGHPEYLKWVIWIVALDTLAVLPFSKLRYEGKPRKFAAIKILNILVNVGLVVFFLVLCKGQHDKGANNIWAVLYRPQIGIGYVFLANLAASALTLLFLARELFSFSPRFNGPLLKEMLIYTAPLLIVGFGGMINETIDRFMIVQQFNGTVEEAKAANGIYSANYKLALLIVLFIQAFRLGAEPFFFREAKSEGAQKTYARVMKFFVIACCFCFLAVVLYLDIWKHFMGIRKHPEYMEGLFVVPILMLSKIFLGVYYNLSIWYKLTNRNSTGALITVGGALITLLVNYLLIPHWGYKACALATLLCYGFMMIASYKLGQKHYPVPYPWKKLAAYVIICVLLFFFHQLFRKFSPGIWWTHAFALTEIIGFGIFLLKVERKEFGRLPYIGRFIQQAFPSGSGKP
jgi:O-antigen/teichoic acid export membrane protein